MSPGAPAEPDQHSPAEEPSAAAPDTQETTPAPETAQPPVKARRSPLQILVIALLILVPTGYGAVAAVQSRNSDGDRHTRSQTTGLLHERPSQLQRRLYRVQLPYNATGVGYFESNAWQTSSLYVQFTTSDGGLDTFLAQLGTERSALRDGRVTVDAAQAARVGWTFGAGHHWAALTLTAKSPAPSHRITVDLDDPARPTVYVVSTTDFH